MFTKVFHIYKLRRAFLGIFLIDTPKGVVVHSKTPNCIHTYIKLGDVIVSVNGRPANGYKKTAKRIVSADTLVLEVKREEYFAFDPL